MPNDAKCQMAPNAGRREIPNRAKCQTAPKSANYGSAS